MKFDISVVICSYNRCKTLPTVLESLLQQKGDEGFSWEVVVVDNNSMDQTRDLIENYQPRFDGKLFYLFEPQQGISHARNLGIRESSSTIVAFTDDDCVVDPYWLANIVELFKTKSCVAMGGRVLPDFPQQTPQWIRECLNLLRGPIVYHDYGEEIKLYQKPMIEILGANMAFRKEVFDRVGYFRTDLGVGQGVMGEETEMFRRLVKNGLSEIYYCGKAMVWHPVELQRMTLDYIAKWNIGLGRYRIIIDQGDKIDPSLAYWFGVPRYLIGQMLGNVKSMVFSLFNRQAFLSAWIEFSRNRGKAIQIRKIYKAEQFSSGSKS